MPRLAGLARAFNYRTGALMGAGTSQPLSTPGRAPVWLALHGYAGAPEEMRPIVELARQEGFAACAPLLVGHGTHARDLAPLSYSDWLEGVRGPFAAAAERGRVLLVGMSLGSLLAVELALEAPDQVLGLVLLANAFFLSPFPGWPLSLVGRLRLPDFGVPKAHADIGDPQARASHLTYSVQPVRAAASVVDAAKRLFQRLPELHCPTLILHGAKDRLCPVSNAWRVAERIGTSEARVLILPRSHHIVTRDFDRAQLLQELRNFTEQLTAGDSPQ